MDIFSITLFSLLRHGICTLTDKFKIKIFKKGFIELNKINLKHFCICSWQNWQKYSHAHVELWYINILLFYNTKTCNFCSILNICQNSKSPRENESRINLLKKKRKINVCYIYIHVYTQIVKNKYESIIL